MSTESSATDAEHIRSIVDSALAFFENLVLCAQQEDEEVYLMLAQVVLNFSTLSDEMDDDARMNYGKLCVGIIVNRLVKDYRDDGNIQPLNLKETLKFLLDMPIEQLLHMKV